MERNRLLTLSLMLLTVFSAVLFLYDGREMETVDPALFRLPAASAPDRVVIAGKSDSVVLTRTGNRWTVNETYEADDRRMRLFFASIDRARPRLAGGGSRGDSILARVGTEGIRVKVGEAGSNLLEFRSAGDPQRMQTWFVGTDLQTAYQMVIPGYRTYLHELFDARANSWRIRRLFDFNWRNFVSLSVMVPSAPASGFTVAREEGIFRISGVADTDTARLNSYLDAVSLAEAAEIMTVSARDRDSLQALQPVVVLSVKETSGRIHELRLPDGPLGILNGTDVVRLSRGTRRVLQSDRKEFLQKKGR